MPYDTIRQKYGNDSGSKLEFFGLEENYPGIFEEWLKNYPAIIELVSGEIFEDIAFSFDFVLTTFIRTIKLKLIKSVFRFFLLQNR
jgi:hypothetical protein